MRSRLLRRGWSGRSEDGQVSLLALAMTIVAILLIMTTAGITAVALARMRLLDAADSAALAAANAFDESTYSGSGVGTAVPVSDASVQAVAADHLARVDLPKGITGWALAGGTGSPDGQTAIVVLTGRVAIPFASAVGVDAGVDLTVESRARAAVR